MQFAVPQFTDVEDKLIGPLTLKQFLILLATGGVVLFFYSLLNFSIFFFFFSAPTALIGLALTFGKFNGRPAMGYLGAFGYFITRPKVRVFKREDITVSLTSKIQKPETLVSPKIGAEDESRLKKLAYLLDQKTEEEKELLEKKS